MKKESKRNLEIKPLIFFYGGFSPFHLGHLEQIEKIATFFPNCPIVIGVSKYKNPEKPSSFSTYRTFLFSSIYKKNNKIKIIEKILQNLPPQVRKRIHIIQVNNFHNLNEILEKLRNSFIFTDENLEDLLNNFFQITEENKNINKFNIKIVLNSSNKRDFKANFIIFARGEKDSGEIPSKGVIIKDYNDIIKNIIKYKAPFLAYFIIPDNKIFKTSASFLRELILELLFLMSNNKQKIENFINADILKNIKQKILETKDKKQLKEFFTKKLKIPFDLINIFLEENLLIKTLNKIFNKLNIKKEELSNLLLNNEIKEIIQILKRYYEKNLFSFLGANESTQNEVLKLIFNYSKKEIFSQIEKNLKSELKNIKNNLLKKFDESSLIKEIEEKEEKFKRLYLNEKALIPSEKEIFKKAFFLLKNNNDFMFTINPNISLKKKKKKKIESIFTFLEENEKKDNIDDNSLDLEEFSKDYRIKHFDEIIFDLLKLNKDIKEFFKELNSIIKKVVKEDFFLKIDGNPAIVFGRIKKPYSSDNKNYFFVNIKRVIESKNSLEKILNSLSKKDFYNNYQGKDIVKNIIFSIWDYLEKFVPENNNNIYIAELLFCEGIPNAPQKIIENKDSFNERIILNPNLVKYIFEKNKIDEKIYENLKNAKIGFVITGIAKYDPISGIFRKKYLFNAEQFKDKFRNIKEIFWTSQVLKNNLVNSPTIKKILLDFEQKIDKIILNLEKNFSFSSKNIEILNKIKIQEFINWLLKNNQSFQRKIAVKFDSLNDYLVYLKNENNFKLSLNEISQNYKKFIKTKINKQSLNEQKINFLLKREFSAISNFIILFLKINIIKEIILFFLRMAIKEEGKKFKLPADNHEGIIFFDIKEILDNDSQRIKKIITPIKIVSKIDFTLKNFEKHKSQKLLEN